MREPNPKYRGEASRYTEDRIMWFKADAVECILYERLPEGDEKGEDKDGNTYIFSYRRKGRSSVMLNLSELTAVEIQQMQEFFAEAFALALPVAQLRDKVADDAFQAGDDSYPRVYRPLSQLVRRPRKKREHDASLQERPLSIPHLDRPLGDSDGSVRVPGSEVAERVSSFDGPQDDWQASDFPA